ncbi:persephin [Sorex araneus]|uniref:persephin n=1 Tax=Sorex araneus TaxID=42254 RepID=UPI000331594C|nr:persephin [Sorex araneus]
MASARLSLGSLLLLSLHLGLCGAPGAQGSPVSEGEIKSELATESEIQRPRLGGRPRRALAGPCQLRSLLLPVAELGLGYASEETVIFRYCAGSCPRGARTQHGLTLARLRRQGRVHGGPCCQPTHYSDVAFLDDQHRWQQLPQFSAAACSCGG